MKNGVRLRSSIMTKGLDRATHRSLFYSMGWMPGHLDKPLVAVVNSFNELMPGHVHLQPLAQAIKLGVAEAGGTPLEFPCIAVCDGIATGAQGHENAHAQPGDDRRPDRPHDHGPCL